MLILVLNDITMLAVSRYSSTLFLCQAGQRLVDAHLCSRAGSAACCGWTKRPRSRSWTRRTGSSGWMAGWCPRCAGGGKQPLLVSVNERRTFNCSKNSTCTSVGAWGRPLCLKSICKTSERHPQSHNQLFQERCMKMSHMRFLPWL